MRDAGDRLSARAARPSSWRTASRGSSSRVRQAMAAAVPRLAELDPAAIRESAAGRFGLAERERRLRARLPPRDRRSARDRRRMASPLSVLNGGTFVLSDRAGDMRSRACGDARVLRRRHAVPLAVASCAWRAVRRSSSPSPRTSTSPRSACSRATRRTSTARRSSRSCAAASSTRSGSRSSCVMNHSDAVRRPRLTLERRVRFRRPVRGQGPRRPGARDVTIRHDERGMVLSYRVGAFARETRIVASRRGEVRRCGLRLRARDRAARGVDRAPRRLAAQRAARARLVAGALRAGRSRRSARGCARICTTGCGARRRSWATGGALERVYERSLTDLGRAAAASRRPATARRSRPPACRGSWRCSGATA